MCVCLEVGGCQNMEVVHEAKAGSARSLAHWLAAGGTAPL